MSTPFRLLIPRGVYERMVAQAVAELPNECCGLLAGRVAAEGGAGPEKRVGRVRACHPLVNVAASPVEYESEPRSMFAAVRAIEQSGLEVLAVYHSHPTSEPVPSRKDRERNYSEEVVNLIISLRDPEPLVQGWWLTAQGHRQADWALEANADDCGSPKAPSDPCSR